MFSYLVGLNKNSQPPLTCPSWNKKINLQVFLDIRIDEELSIQIDQSAATLLLPFTQQMHVNWCSRPWTASIQTSELV